MTSKVSHASPAADAALSAHYAADGAAWAAHYAAALASDAAHYAQQCNEDE